MVTIMAILILYTMTPNGFIQVEHVKSFENAQVCSFYMDGMNKAFLEHDIKDKRYWCRTVKIYPEGTEHL